MLNAQLAEKEKQLKLALVEKNNDYFLETMRGVARILYRKLKRPITNDDVRDYYESHRGTLPLIPTSQNVWSVLFRTKEWKRVGTVKSAQVQGHGNYIGSYVLVD